MKRLIAIICAFLLTVGSVNVLGAETAVFEKMESADKTAMFQSGRFTVWYQVQDVSRPGDTSFYNGEYTVVKSKAGQESNGNFGSVNIVNRFKDENGSLGYIGLTDEAVKNMTLKMKVKLDDVRNRNLKIVFCSIVDNNGEYVTSGDYTNDGIRREYCDSKGNMFIDIGEYVEETTQWQTVEVPLDLSDFTRVAYYPGQKAAADWTKATAIQVVSRNTDNAFSDKENPATSIEIAYGDIYLEFGDYKMCTAEVKTTNSQGEVESLVAGQTITSTVSLKNDTSFDDHKGLAMFAVYKDKELIHLESKFVTVEPKDTSDFSFDSYTLPSDVSGMEVITYLWDDFLGMQAITAPLTVGGSL
ncbi:MAG: hypothetical protein IJN96_02815 [Clostridia bacterium]|nr:hypothetical protein [Clostridia bacterium]